MRKERFLSSLGLAAAPWGPGGAGAGDGSFGKHLGPSQLGVLFCSCLLIPCSALKIGFSRWFSKGLGAARCDFERALCVWYLIIPLVFIISDNLPPIERSHPQKRGFITPFTSLPVCQVRFFAAFMGFNQSPLI